jgi:predicted secreted protein with PEFG-CTERM motif
VVIAIVTLVGGLTIMPAFGQSDSRDTARELVLKQIPIRVYTDKTDYEHGSIIQVEGAVANIRPGTEVGLKVIGPPPFNNVVAVDQIKINPDGTFRTTLSTSGQLWKADGAYTIRATYGHDNIFDKVTVNVIGGAVEFGIGKCRPNQIAASGICLDYTINGARVTFGNIIPQTTSLILNIETDDNGNIEITLPRNIMDSKINGNDDPFIILIDGEEVSYHEVASSTMRKVAIDFPIGAEQIEIIGTFVIPEFGTIAVVILAVSIIAIIAISAKTRLNVLPKY